MKKVYQYNLDNNLIQIFNSQQEAASSVGVDESQIRRYIKGINKRTQGFKWSDKMLGTSVEELFQELETITDTTLLKAKESLIEAKKSFDEELDRIAPKTNRVLIVGDLHVPFERTGYFEFCKNIYIKYNCNKVIFIGDLIDNHFSSFHDTDPDGHSAGEELRLAKLSIAKWYKTFPKAKVCLGNHDNIPIRKAFNTGVSTAWIKSVGEVLDTPDWEYEEEFILDNILYTHGIGRKAFARMQADLTSVVQGHYHSESYIQYSVGRSYKLFAMQVGCGIDDKSYAMAYGKHFNKMHINCGVVLENGKLPILEYMDL